MAFPVVAGVQLTTNAVGTSHTVDFDATPTTGDLLLVFFALTGNTTVTFPAGWVNLFDLGLGAYTCYYKVAAGEGASISVTTTSGEISTAYAFRISAGTFSGAPAWSSGGGADPPSLTSGFGAIDALWFACINIRNAAGFTAHPTSYTDGVNVDAGTASQAISRRELNAATEDPGAFTLEYTIGSLAVVTVAVGKSRKRLTWSAICS